jgi:hypothetical protein
MVGTLEWRLERRGKGNGSIRKDMKKLRPRKRGNWYGGWDEI